MSTLETLKEKFPKEIVEIYEHSRQRAYVTIEPKDIPSIAGFVFKDLGCRFVIASGIDTPDAIEILYHFSNDSTGQMVTLKTRIKDKKNPRIESLAPQFKAAEWIEREMWELLGIQFDNHPNLTRLLLDEDFPEDFKPLRHDDKETK